MELLIWQWSTGVQVASALRIAVFFVALRRAGDARAESALAWWVRAWLANFGALLVTVVFWLLQPPPSTHALVRALYMGAKGAFVLLLAQGVWALHRPAVRAVRAPYAALALTAWAAAGAFVFTSVDQVGAAQHAMIALGFGACGAALLRSRARQDARDDGLGWLASALLLRGAMAAVESAAYVARHLRPERAAGLGHPLGIFLAAHSSVDTGIEWGIALGCVLALARQVQAELRRLADRDALTGLAARRTLPRLLRDASRDGATLLFLDLDGFKAINDRLGHLAGDEYLVRFATALVDAFAPHDTVRYAGDEFVVIARGVAESEIDARLAGLRASGIAFSAGRAALRAGGDADATLQAADDAMYRAKSARRDAAA